MGNGRGLTAYLGEEARDRSMSAVDGGQPGGGGGAVDGSTLRAEEQQLERKAIVEAGDIREEGLLPPKGCVLPSDFSELGASWGTWSTLRKSLSQACSRALQTAVAPRALGKERRPKFLANTALLLPWEEGVTGWAPPKESPLGSQGVSWEPHLLAICGGLSPNGHA